MTSKTIKVAMFAVFAIVALMASPIALTAQAQTTTLTRHIGEDEFGDTVEQIHMMRAEQTRLNEQVELEDVDNSARISELDLEIEKLMPILDRHQEQTFAKYYIEPSRKQYLESVETDLRADVYDALIEKVDYFGVNLNTKDKVIEIVLNDPTQVDAIEKLIQQQPQDIEYKITIAEYKDLACANQTDDCDPIVGGVEVEGFCTQHLIQKYGEVPTTTSP